MQIRKAERRRAKLRLGLVGPSGSGKTRSALEIAFGLGGKIGMIDTEHGSGDLYADLGDYDIIQIGAPYLVPKYLSAIKAFEDAGHDVIIIDSLSHAWAGEGGLLDKQGKIADSGIGNSYTAWRKVTPEHNALVDAILQSPSHVIATMRAKQDYVQEKDEKTGKTVVKKIGLAPVQRDGMEYEMTVVMDIDANHVAHASKDRTGLLDGRYFTPARSTGEELLGWLESGAEPIAIIPIDERPLYVACKAAIDLAKDEPALHVWAKDNEASLATIKDDDAEVYNAVRGYWAKRLGECRKAAA
jgi:hypothetical protein